MTAAEVEQRLSAIEDLLLEGLPRAAIVARFAESGLAPRTVDDYIRRVRERWAYDRVESSATEREQAIARLRRLSRTLEERGAWSALVSCERLLIDVLGLRAPKVELHASVNPPIQLRDKTDPRKFLMERLTDEELDSLDRILSKIDTQTAPPNNCAQSNSTW